MRHFSKQLFSWLRRLARHGSVLGGVDTGAFILAEARLLDDYEATVHRESITTFRERYTKTKVTERLFVTDRDRTSCAGGHATLDLMLNLIVARQGTSLAQIVANSFISPRMRQGLAAQRIDPPDRPSKSCNVLTRILHHMEDMWASRFPPGSWRCGPVCQCARSAESSESTPVNRQCDFTGRFVCRPLAMHCSTAKVRFRTSPFRVDLPRRRYFPAHSGRILTIAPEFRLKTMDDELKLPAHRAAAEIRLPCKLTASCSEPLAWQRLQPD